jgi:hypothetical protein
VTEPRLDRGHPKRTPTHDQFLSCPTRSSYGGPTGIYDGAWGFSSFDVCSGRHPHGTYHRISGSVGAWPTVLFLTFRIELYT